MKLKALLILAPLSVTGCTTLHVVPPVRSAVSAELAAGDRVEVLLSSNELHEITVLRVTDAGIVSENDLGQETLMRYEEIAGHQVRRIAIGKSLGLAAGIAAAVIAIQNRDSCALLSSSC